jgi:ribosomal protein L25 (general stress protein Ctc)
MSASVPTRLDVRGRESAGSRSVRRLRREGFVPGVLYGGGGDAVSFAVDERELRHALAARGAVLEVAVDGGRPTPAVLKDHQRDPARGAYRLPLERVLVVHDEIDLPFGEVRSRVGGGLAGHNGLKSLRAELGGGDFARVRVGVGRPPSSAPDVVADYVLSRFREPSSEVDQLVDRACDAVAAVVSAH